MFSVCLNKAILVRDKHAAKIVTLKNASSNALDKEELPPRFEHLSPGHQANVLTIELRRFPNDRILCVF